MAGTDPFLAGLANLVRGMSDDAILALVRDKLGVITAAVEAPLASPARKGARPQAAAPAPVARKKARRKSAPRDPAARGKLLEAVERAVKGGKGMSASEVAKATSIPQGRVTTALRELKTSKRIFQGGDRRFARYAGDAKVAQAASDAARTSASGPAGKGKRRKA